MIILWLKILIQELKTIITNHNFKLVGDIENRGKFIYIIGTKN